MVQVQVLPGDTEWQSRILGYQPLTRSLTDIFLGSHYISGSLGTFVSTMSLVATYVPALQILSD